MLRENRSVVTKSLHCDKLIHYGSVNPAWKRQSIAEESIGCGAGRGARLEFPREFCLEALGVRVQVGLRRQRAPARASASSCGLRFEKKRVKWLRERGRDREGEREREREREGEREREHSRKTGRCEGRAAGASLPEQADEDTRGVRGARKKVGERVLALRVAVAHDGHENALLGGRGRRVEGRRAEHEADWALLARRERGLEGSRAHDGLRGEHERGERREWREENRRGPVEPPREGVARRVRREHLRT